MFELRRLIFNDYCTIIFDVMEHAAKLRKEMYESATEQAEADCRAKLIRTDASAIRLDHMLLLFGALTRLDRIRT